MSYTNINLVKKHLAVGNLPGGLQKDYPVVFAGLEELELPGHSIVKDSPVVKALGSAEPTYEEKVLSGSVVSLAHDHLVPGSVAAASDSSLGLVYVENVDYAIDYTGGTITRIDGGNIATASTVSVWYYYYSQYAEGVDYGIGYQYGTIKRLSDGAIQVGQMVLIDYQLAQSQLNDDIIAEAVNEANSIVAGQVDPERTFGADLVLQTAATYLAVSFLCRIEASGSLRSTGGGERDARSWLTLGDSYRADYEMLIRKFRPGAARLNRPARS